MTVGPRTEPLPRRDMRSMFAYALEAVLPEAALRRYVSIDEDGNTLMVDGRSYDLRQYTRIVVVGGGKAGRRTSAELVRILGDRITVGALNVYLDQAAAPISENVALFPADHPTPNAAGVEGAWNMVELLKDADPETLVIALISGGGSSLMALPVQEITLDDYVAISTLLLTVPATIDEINAVRKHLDVLKGGGMRKMAARAGGFLSLVLSDVPVTKTGVVDDASVIASGPTVGDDSTFQDAKTVLTKYGIWEDVPDRIKAYIDANIGRTEHETLPKESELLQDGRSQYVMIANNDLAMEAAGEKAEELGYTVQLIGCRSGSTAEKIKGEVTEEIDRIWQVLTPYLRDGDRVTFGSFSTDGIDGHSELAGAIADPETLRQAEDAGMDYRRYLAGYDSASLFQALDLGIAVGPSGTNVADISIALITNPTDAQRKLAIIFGGEATVHVDLAEGQQPGFGGRNTHLVLLAAEKLAQNAP